MRLKNVKIFLENGTFQNGEVQIEGARFGQICCDCKDGFPASQAEDLKNPLLEYVKEAENADEAVRSDIAEEILDGKGCYAIPGLIDIHFHGCMGEDFCNGTEQAIATIAEYELSQGVTSICPATMTLPEEYLMQVMRAAGSYSNEAGAELIGINMEGPFLSYAKKGAQNPDYIRPCDVELFRRLNQESGGLVKLVDIAPEEPGAAEFIAACHEETNISLAHTAADYDTALQAYRAGANHATHLYNAMPPFSHRSPGIIGAAADCDHVYVELICDGIHIHPSVVRTTLKMFGEDRVVFISDSMEATGMPDGTYQLGGQKVYKKGKEARLEDGTIAGSASSLYDCLRTAVGQMEIPLETAVKCATINSARSIGVEQEYGSISTGKFANLVLLDDKLQIQGIFLKGKVVSWKI